MGEAKFVLAVKCLCALLFCIWNCHLKKHCKANDGSVRRVKRKRTGAALRVICLLRWRETPLICMQNRICEGEGNKRERQKNSKANFSNALNQTFCSFTSHSCLNCTLPCHNMWRWRWTAQQSVWCPAMQHKQTFIYNYVLYGRTGCTYVTFLATI